MIAFQAIPEKFTHFDSGDFKRPREARRVIEAKGLQGSSHEENPLRKSFCRAVNRAFRSCLPCAGPLYRESKGDRLRQPMQVIELDAARWKTIIDFYDDLLAVLGAPDWHGYSPDALIDSMIWSGMNAINPPYKIVVHNIGEAPGEVVDHVKLAKEDLAEGRAYFRAQKGYDVIVDFEVFE
jgi:RNAse (barnase) inhibitor barstar